MNEKKIFNNGIKSGNISKIEWEEHSKFKGVLIKNVLSGRDTNYKISTHIVKVNPNCEIGNHIHEGKTELHEIIEGQGTATINGKEVEYTEGIVSFIPEDIPHKIYAGEKGLMLLAKFVPSL